MKNLLFLLSLHLLTVNLTAQPSIQWAWCIGGNGDESPNAIQQTSDGGYVLAGYSSLNNGDVTGNHGGGDYWVVKLTSLGYIEWEKSLGGSKDENAFSIIQTSDGGYVLGGHSFSNNGDVTVNHGDADSWVVKLDSNGGLQWQKSLGGSGADFAYSIQETNDGGYVVAGSSKSNDGDVTGNHGAGDFWVVKLNAVGDLQWQKTMGGSAYDGANSIQQTTDGGFIIAGETRSNDFDVSGNNGGTDFWIVKINDVGDIQWQKSLGGTLGEESPKIKETIDGAFIVSGTTYSNNKDVSGNHGNSDVWVVKLEAMGNIIWQKTFGGSDFDEGRDIQKTTDGGFIVAGFTQSNDGDVSGNQGQGDFWLFKISDLGQLQWQKTLGGSFLDIGLAAQQTLDEGYIIAGLTDSNDGDVFDSHGGHEFWVVKLGAVSEVKYLHDEQPGYLEIFPNPAHNKVSLKTNSEEFTLTVSITDAPGRKITQQTIQNGGSMDIPTLPNGIYSIVATTPSGKVYSNKLTISK